MVAAATATAAAAATVPTPLPSTQLQRRDVLGQVQHAVENAGAVLQRLLRRGSQAA